MWLVSANIHPECFENGIKQNTALLREFVLWPPLQVDYFCGFGSNNTAQHSSQRHRVRLIYMLI